MHYMAIGAGRANAHAKLSGITPPSVEDLLSELALDLWVKTVHEPRWRGRFWVSEPRDVVDHAPILWAMEGPGKVGIAALDLSDAAYGTNRLTAAIERHVLELVA